MNKTDTVAPHPPLTDYYADETARHRWLRTIFNASAVDYDRIEGLMAFGTGPWYRRQALRRAGLAPGMQVLDVGTGTGLTAIQAVRITGGGANVTGVDPSVGMLANARLPEGMRVIEGRAEALPAADSAFDFVSMGYALRHVADLRTVFGEFFRVSAARRPCVRARDHASHGCPRNALVARVLALSGAARGALGRALARYAGSHALLVGLDRSMRAAATSHRPNARGRV